MNHHALILTGLGLGFAALFPLPLMLLISVATILAVFAVADFPDPADACVTRQPPPPRPTTGRHRR